MAAPLTGAGARQQAQAEGLTLLRSESSASGFQNVCIHSSGRGKPYEARVWHGSEKVYLGNFTTAEEAALAIARSPEGKAAAAAAAATPAPLTATEARRQAEAEGLTLLRSESNVTGFKGVAINSASRVKPYKAQVQRGGTRVGLGYFATAEEAALAFARSPEGRAAAAAAAAAPAPLTAAEARRQAKAEDLMLLGSESSASGFQGVSFDSRGKAKPYQARVRRDGKMVRLGYFATAAEAALAFARTPEARVAAAAAAAAQAPRPRAARARRQAEAPAPAVSTLAPKTEPQPSPVSGDAALKEEEAPPLWPDGAVVVKTEVDTEPSLKQAPPAMPDGTVVKEEAWPVEGPANVQAVAGSSAAVARKRRRLGSS